MSKQTSEKKFSEIYTYSPLNKYEGLRGSMECRAPSTYVGVEIELEKVTILTNPPSSFHMTNDGSLKLSGKEFITIPIRFCYLEQELKRLYGSMKPPYVSSRCSVHVHLNVRDFTAQELYRFMLLYLIFEKSLFRFSGNRIDNIFCTPLSSYLSNVSHNMGLLSKGAVTLMSWSKYYALNLAPIWGQGDESGRIGTVEFRHMAGSTSVEHIIEWINLIVSLKIAAKKMNTDSLVDSLKTMNTESSYNHLVSSVFKKWADYLTEQPTFKQDVEEGVLLAKTSLLYNKKPKKVEIEIQYSFQGESACVV